MAKQPSLIVDSAPGEPAFFGIGVYPLDPDLMLSLCGYLNAGGQPQSILRVTVVQRIAPTGANLPDVLGRYRMLEDGIRFEPYFPFEQGLPYRASFDPRRLGRSDFAGVLTLEFTLPREQSASPPEVEHIFPSSDRLPENLLRFYVCFSKPMQRGRVEAEVALRGPDGEPAPDVLYRAPVELWDRSMKCLTILLDPGRLKRGVGPNRELGPPLEVGQQYTLSLGAGMTDIDGSGLSGPIHKHFTVTDAVREPIAVEQWRITFPVKNSLQPVMLTFPRPLDWALLSSTITIVSARGQPIAGRTAIDQCERRWSFTPTWPWTAGFYHLSVASDLEDVCGNSVLAAFDRPIRPGSNLGHEVATSSIPFDI